MDIAGSVCVCRRLFLISRTAKAPIAKMIITTMANINIATTIVTPRRSVSTLLPLINLLIFILDRYETKLLFVGSYDLHPLGFQIQYLLLWILLAAPCPGSRRT